MNKFEKNEKTTNKSYHQMALRLGLEIYTGFVLFSGSVSAVSGMTFVEVSLRILRRIGIT